MRVCDDEAMATLANTPVIDRVDVYLVALPLARPWESAHGRMAQRRTLLVRVASGPDEGWGECPTLDQPGYSAEWTDGAFLVLTGELAPTLLAGEADTHPDLHPMASSAIEAAVTDLMLRRNGVSLATHLGATRPRVAGGIVIGLQSSVDDLLVGVGEAVTAGYQRVKVKIEPDRSAAWLAAVRREHPDLELWADGNGTFDLANPAHRHAVHAVDNLGLRVLEQPLAADDLDGHIELSATLCTPICLDEPLLSLAHTVDAVERGACSVVNLKPSRVGGWAEAQRIVEWCAAQAVDVWIGGMVESGVGRAANIAFAALDGITLTGDVSPSDRFFVDDVVTPRLTMDDGWIAVPSGPGIGVAVDVDRLHAATERRIIIA